MPARYRCGSGRCSIVRRTLRRLGPIASLLLILAAIACGGGVDVGDDRATAGAPSDSALRALTYPAPELPAGRVTLTNGDWVGDPTVVGRPRASLAFTAHGDLSGDGRPDAVVVLLMDPGATARFFDIVPVLAGAVNPRAGRATALGDRVRPESLWVAGGRAHLRLVAHDTADGLCCPTRREERRYQLVGDSLVPERAALIERLSAEPG